MTCVRRSGDAAYTRLTRAHVATAATSGPIMPANASGLTARPPTIVATPSTAGGAGDIFARTIGQALAEKFGKQVVIDGVPQFRATHREDVVPRSGRDREKIAHEFQRGLQRLVLAIARFGRYDINEVWVQPRTDGAAAIHRASHAPNGTYRMWGGAPIIDRVLDDLVAAHGDGLIFATPELARTALEEADKGRLKRLEPEELAA